MLMQMTSLIGKNSFVIAHSMLNAFQFTYLNPLVLTSYIHLVNTQKAILPHMEHWYKPTSAFYKEFLSNTFYQIILFTASPKYTEFCQSETYFV